MTRQLSKKRWGVLLCLGMLVAIPAVASQVVMTVKGTVSNGSWNTLGIFENGNNLDGQPFTLTITFDAPPPTVEPGNKCPASLIKGTSANPARAVITIGKDSYTFGTKADSKWDAMREATPHCSGRGVGFHVTEGVNPQTSNVWLSLLGPNRNSPNFGSSWDIPVPTTKVVGLNSAFSITRPGDSHHSSGGILNPETLSISSGNANSRAQGADSDGSSIVRSPAGISVADDKLQRQAGEVAITVKGKVSIGHDDYGIFKVGRNLAGQNFTLVYTFTKSAQHGSHLCDDKSGGASYFGTAKTPAKAVLTIGNGSFTFGDTPDSTWGVSRGIPSECTDDEIEMNVKEGIYPQVTLLQVKLQAPPGGVPLNTTIDWNSPLSSSNLDKSPLLSSFGISHPNDYEHSVHGVLIPESVTIDAGARGGADLQAETVDGPNGSAVDDTSNAAKQSDGKTAASDGSSTSPATAQQSLKDAVRKAVGRWLPKIAVPNR